MPASGNVASSSADASRISSAPEVQELGGDLLAACSASVASAVGAHELRSVGGGDDAARRIASPCTARTRQGADCSRRRARATSARSASRAVAGCAVLEQRERRRSGRSSVRHWIARDPCPGAGTITSTRERLQSSAGCSFSRSSPAAASTAMSGPPSAVSLRRRVGTLPRKVDDLHTGEGRAELGATAGAMRCRRARRAGARRRRSRRRRRRRGRRADRRVRAPPRSRGRLARRRADPSPSARRGRPGRFAAVRRSRRYIGPCARRRRRRSPPASPVVSTGSSTASMPRCLQQEPNRPGLRHREVGPAGRDPERGHEGSVVGISPRSSASSSARPRGRAPGSIRSFMPTIGSCRSLAATPRATASTAVALDRGRGRRAGMRTDRAPRWTTASPRAAERLDHRRELVAATAGDPPPDLLGRRSRGRARCPRRSRGECSATRSRSGEDVDQADAAELARPPGSTSRGTARSRNTSGRPPRGRIARRRSRRHPSRGRPRRSPRRRGRRRDEGPGSASGRRGRRSSGRPARGRAQGAVEDPDRADASAGVGAATASAAIWPAPTTTTVASAQRPPSASSARSAPSATNASGAAPSAVSWRTRRPARTAAWNTAGEAGPAASSASARRRASRTWRGSASRRAPSSRARRDREQVVGRVALPVRVQGSMSSSGAMPRVSTQHPLQRRGIRSGSSGRSP